MTGLTNLSFPFFFSFSSLFLIIFHLYSGLWVIIGKASSFFSFFFSFPPLSFLLFQSELKGKYDVGSALLLFPPLFFFSPLPLLFPYHVLSLDEEGKGEAGLVAATFPPFFSFIFFSFPHSKRNRRTRRFPPFILSSFSLLQEKQFGWASIFSPSFFFFPLSRLSLFA